MRAGNIDSHRHWLLQRLKGRLDRKRRERRNLHRRRYVFSPHVHATAELPLGIAARRRPQLRLLISQISCEVPFLNERRTCGCIRSTRGKFGVSRSFLARCGRSFALRLELWGWFIRSGAKPALSSNPPFPTPALTGCIGVRGSIRTGRNRNSANSTCTYYRSRSRRLSRLLQNSSRVPKAGGDTAGPSTALRSGRDDNSVAAEIDSTERSLTQAAAVAAGIDSTEQSLTPAAELSSRPERSAVEGPAVSPPAFGTLDEFSRSLYLGCFRTAYLSAYEAKPIKVCLFLFP